MSSLPTASEKLMRVVVTGGAGQIAYSLIPHIASGFVFGADVCISLRLLDIPLATDALHGVEMEIQDSTWTLVKEVIPTTDPEVAFRDVDVAILLGGFPRRPGMDRSDVIAKNVPIMKANGISLENYASSNVKVLVVANPANTNCLIVKKFAPSIPSENFTALTRLDHERLRGMLANQFGQIQANKVKNAVIWGNHSSTQVPDLTAAVALLPNSNPNEAMQNQLVHSISNRSHNSTWQSALNLLGGTPGASIFGDEAGTLAHELRFRGAAVLEARKLSSAMSAAKAVALHLRDWCGNVNTMQKAVATEEGVVVGGGAEEVVSMAVCSDNNPYQPLVPPGLIFSFPIKCHGGGGGGVGGGWDYEIDASFAHLQEVIGKGGDVAIGGGSSASDYVKSYSKWVYDQIEATVRELVTERDIALALIAANGEETAKPAAAGETGGKAVEERHEWGGGKGSMDSINSRPRKVMKSNI